MAGLGLNFGIVVGALAGMISLIFVRYHYTVFSQFPGLLMAFLVATPIAILFGYLTGKLYNKTRGQEMVASLIVGFFAQGLYMIFVIVGFFVSEFTASMFANELTMRFFRNGVLVLSLIIPVMAGLGLNFGIVVGALAGMIALIFVRYHYTVFTQFPGLLMAFLVATPIAILFGYLTGKLYNKTRGQEMVASLIVGFFAQGLYMIFVLYIIGTLIPVTPGHRMVIPGEQGIGIAHTFDLGLPPAEMTARHTGLPGIARSMNNIWQVEFTTAIVVVSVALLAYVLIRRYMEYKNPALGKKPKWQFYLQIAACFAAVAFSIYSAVLINYWYRVLAATRAYLGNDRLHLSQLDGISPFAVEISNINQVPVVMGLVILAVGLFTVYFTKTKLGQDCRSVGQSQHIANVAGINVDRTRIIATVISTVLASWGMIIFLQDMGHVSTYTAHVNIGFFSIAALLVGGATAAKAGVKNAIMGIFLFHAMFVLSPAMGRFISDNAGVGEYMRSFMVYGAIGVSLGIYVWKNNRAATEKERL